MNVIKETITELKRLGVDGFLINVIVTRWFYAPWTLSYVKYEDGTIGCGCANNTRKVPDDVSFMKDLLNLNVYNVIDKLHERESSVFTNSLLLSISSAISHRLLNDEIFLKKEGILVETTPISAFRDPTRYAEIKSSDVVAIVGFASWAIPRLSEIAHEVHVTELMSMKDLSVIDFDPKESNVRIFPADKNEEVLREADVVFITGETLVNETFNELIEFSRNARTRIVYGPTSSFYPKALFKKGVDVSLGMVFPNTPDSKKKFVISRGDIFYAMSGVKYLLMKKGFVNHPPPKN